MDRRVIWALAAVTLAVATSGCGGRRVVRGGPLECPRCQGDASMPMAVGALGAYGAANLQNHGKVPLVLERVAYLHRTPGLLLLGPVVVKSSAPSVGLIREFPPGRLARKLNLLPGYEVPPYHHIEDDVDILVGVAPLRKGSVSYSGSRSITAWAGSIRHDLRRGCTRLRPGVGARSRCEPPASIG